MARLEINSFVEVIATKRVGVVVDRDRTKVYVNFMDKELLETDEEVFDDYELKLVELERLRTSQLRPLVRGELDLKEISNGTNLFPDQVKTDDKAYHITVEDLLFGIEAMEKRSAFDAALWMTILFQFEEDLHFEEECDFDVIENIEERYMLSYAYEIMDSLRWIIMEEELESQEIAFEYLKDTLKRWMESEEHEYSLDFCERMTRDFDCDSIDKVSPPVQQLFKHCLDQLCDSKDTAAIQKRGYCYYCGTEIYPQDWYKARDAFLDYYQLTGDASAANTLGYIYYYGRCNNRIPEYEKAFYYFSIGHAFGYYESSYKLADMFHHGYGVVKSDETANRLYWNVYNENYQRFVKGEFACKFADAALRIGNTYRVGIGVTQNKERAYQYYLQADLAIQKRMKVANHYGDQTVYHNIQKALEETRPDEMSNLNNNVSAFPLGLNHLDTKEYHKKMRVRECEDGTYSLTFSLVPRGQGEKPPYIFVSDIRTDYCNLVRKLTMKTAKGSRVTGIDTTNEIFFDEFSYDFIEKKTSFYFNAKVVGEIISEEYQMIINEKSNG